MTKRRTIRFFLIISAFLICILQSSCSRASPPVGAETVILAMIKTEGDLPAGKIFSVATSTTSATGSSELSPALASALYGQEFSRLIYPDDAGGDVPITDMAVYLSAAKHPCELAVFRCSDADTARSVAKHCLARLDTVKNAWRNSENGYREYVDCAEVTIIKNYVLLAISSHPELAFREAKKVIG